MEDAWWLKDTWTEPCVPIAISNQTKNNSLKLKREVRKSKKESNTAS